MSRPVRLTILYGILWVVGLLILASYAAKLSI